MNKTSYSEGYPLRNLDKKRWLIDDDLTGPTEKMAVPPNSPRHKAAKLHNYAHKTL